MASSSDLKEFFDHPAETAGAFLQRRHVALWLIAASELLTAFQMREGVAALVVLAINATLLALAVTLFKRGPAAVWLAVASEITVATQMAPDRHSFIVLAINAALLAAAVLAARLAARAKAE